MSKYALIEDGIVVNIIEWDGSDSWTVPDGHTALALPSGSPVGPGFAYASGTYSAPVTAGPTAAQLWATHQSIAQAALDASDMTAIRCMKAGVAFPAAWLAYCQALRAIVAAMTGDPTAALPTKPAYPAGT